MAESSKKNPAISELTIVKQKFDTFMLNTVLYGKVSYNLWSIIMLRVIYMTHDLNYGFTRSRLLRWAFPRLQLITKLILLAYRITFKYFETLWTPFSEDQPLCLISDKKSLNIEQPLFYIVKKNVYERSVMTEKCSKIEHWYTRISTSYTHDVQNYNVFVFKFIWLIFLTVALSEPLSGNQTHNKFIKGLLPVTGS